MATLIAGPASGGANMLLASIGGYNSLTLSASNATLVQGDYRAIGDPNYQVQFVGGGFTYGPSGGFPTAGVVTGIHEYNQNGAVTDIVDFGETAARFFGWVETGNTRTAFSTILSGPDSITGSSSNDTFIGFNGADSMAGAAGTDTAVYLGNEADYYVVAFGNQLGVLNLKGGSATDGGDRLYDFEQLGFEGGNAGVPSIYTAAQATDENFQALRYIASYGDLINSIGANPQAAFDEYTASGYAAGRTTTFDPVAYASANPDVAAAFGNNLDAITLHYIQHGYAEGRATTPGGGGSGGSGGGGSGGGGSGGSGGGGSGGGGTFAFEPYAYIASYPDLLAAFGSNANAATQHYQQSGQAEGRAVHFDSAQYLANYPDLQAAFGQDQAAAARHFITSGLNEGRSDTPGFNALEYIASYTDLMKAFGPSPAAGGRHWFQAGEAEGRAVTFDAQQYLQHYPDLQAAFGSNLNAAAAHYITNGYQEGRTDHG